MIRDHCPKSYLTQKAGLIENLPRKGNAKRKSEPVFVFSEKFPKKLLPVCPAVTTRVNSMQISSPICSIKAVGISKRDIPAHAKLKSNQKMLKKLDNLFVLALSESKGKRRIPQRSLIRGNFNFGKNWTEETIEVSFGKECEDFSKPNPLSLF